MNGEIGLRAVFLLSFSRKRNEIAATNRWQSKADKNAAANETRERERESGDDWGKKARPAIAFRCAHKASKRLIIASEEKLRFDVGIKGGKNGTRKHGKWVDKKKKQKGRTKLCKGQKTRERKGQKAERICCKRNFSSLSDFVVY